ncbi:MAG: hypothetical protein DRJ05_00230 [Bacteroidetes bacterium]|nr:MAG: hypothetical protein DRI89_00110 [Bacteroidota bacterium]RLD62487.1 MAG: hypothetical protein DRJ05_00230 [Bacteroidota bacterium]
MKTKSFELFKIIEIEINSICNRDCEFCPRYYNRSGIRKDKDGKLVRKQMSSEKVKAIIDEVTSAGFRGKIRFHRLSEPLVDARYLDFVKYASSKGLLVVDHTNGDILKTNPDLCKQLDGLVDEFTIGLYDYSTYKGKQKEIAFWKASSKKQKLHFHCLLNTQIFDRAQKCMIKSIKIPE